MSRYGIELYSSLEAETGLATGWKQCGSLNVFKTKERLKLSQRQMARAKSFGIEFEFISPGEAGKIAPILRTDDLSGALGKRSGVNVPLYAAEHFYIVTDKIEGVTPSLPVVRDPDGFVYYKEE